MRVFLHAAIATAILVAPLLAGPVYAPSGPQTFVNSSAITSGGWTMCFSETYGTYGTSIASATSNCTGDLLMMGGGPTGSSVLDVIAWAPTTDVMFFTGTSNTPHNANQTGWYFSDSYSWGFAPQGAAISRSSCDTSGSIWSSLDGTQDQRLCWHTSSNTLQGGWRSGNNINLNGSSEFTRYLFTASSAGEPAATPEPSTWGMLMVAGAVTAVRSRKMRTRE